MLGLMSTQGNHETNTVGIEGDVTEHARVEKMSISEGKNGAPGGSEVVNLEAVGIETPEEDVHMEDVRGKMVKIQLYRKPRDWVAIKEVTFFCESDGTISLEKIKWEFGIEGVYRVRAYFLEGQQC